MSLDCPLTKPACKRSVISGKTPYEKPKCPLTDLVPKCSPTPTPKCPLLPDPCPLTCPPPTSPCPLASLPLNSDPSPCPSAPPKCPLAPDPCPPPPCPLVCPPPPKCPLAPDPCPPTPCPLAPPKCPLAPDPCPPPPCPLVCPPPPKCPLAPDPCPPPPCPLVCPPPSPCPLAPPKCPQIPNPCPLACPPPPKCPLAPNPCPPPPCIICPPPCPPPKCPLAPSPCPVICLPPPKCPLIPEPCPPPCPPPKCPLAPNPCPPPPCPVICLPPPKCPLIPEPCPLSPPKCPLIPSPCPLKIPLKPQCPLLPPKCPLNPPPCPLQSPSTDDGCPLSEPFLVESPCFHNQFLNKSISRKPLSFPMPLPVCHEIARKCPFEPRPMVCHDSCPCSNVPEVDAGPPCPFFIPEPVCPPVCPLEKQPDCPLIQKPRCMWKPQVPTQCPLTTPSCPQECPAQCALQNYNVCPSFLPTPGKAKTPPPKRPLNITCCPFCEEKPKPICQATLKGSNKNDNSFHFPSCRMFKATRQQKSLPTDKPVCPFYPSPCPLTGSGDCPIKVPPSGTRNTQSLECFCEQKSTNSCQSNNNKQPTCHGSTDNLIKKPQCPLANFECPSPPPPPCPVKGCLKKPSNKNSEGCPQKTDSCLMFPEGRCPKEDLGLCDCDYPVPPCMADSSNNKKRAPSQFCVKDDCCMGLPDPPIIPAKDYPDTYYSFVALHPEKESTKYYIDISDEPPDDVESFTFGLPKKPVQPQCSVIKGGDGYKQCRTVKDILEKRGSCADTSSQYDPHDCPMDNMTRMIRMSKSKSKSKNKKK